MPTDKQALQWGEALRGLRRGSAALALGVLLGCQPPTIDGTSDEAMKASIEEMKRDLSPEEAERLAEALMVVMFSSAGTTLADIAKNPGGAIENARHSLDGKSAPEILAVADRIKAERAARERTQALEEIRELQARKAAAEAARGQLAGFQVLKSRFSKEKSGFIEQRVIDLEVKNGTEHPVSRAHFKGTLATPGRAVPWLAQDFNYPIPGGLEPGETAQWSLNPNMFSGWGTVEPRPDMVFTVEVVRLDGADGESLFDSSWAERDEERLQSLASKFQ